jgi:oligoendopeptidase F
VSTLEAELESVVWDLEPLVDARGDAGVDELLDDATRRAEGFAERYRGEVGRLDPEQLAGAMEELAAIHELAGRAGSYAMLRFSTDTADPAAGALLQRVRERGTAIETGQPSTTSRRTRCSPTSGLASAAITSATCGVTGRTCSRSPRNGS